MRKDKIVSLIPGATPSVFLAFKKNVQIPEIQETPSSTDLSELSNVATSMPQITPRPPSPLSAHNELVEPDEPNQPINPSYLRWSHYNKQARNLKKKINRLKTKAYNISQTISNMEIRKKKDANLLNILEVD